MEPGKGPGKEQRVTVPIGIDSGFPMGRCLLKALRRDIVQREPCSTDKKPQKGGSGPRLCVVHSVVWPKLVARLSGSLSHTSHGDREVFRHIPLPSPTRSPQYPAHVLSSNSNTLPH